MFCVRARWQLLVGCVSKIFIVGRSAADLIAVLVSPVCLTSVNIADSVVSIAR